MLTTLARGPRIGFPRVMRLVRWLDRPAVTTTAAATIAPAVEPAPAGDEDDMPWNLIVAMASDLSHEDLHEMVPSEHGGAGSVEDLTPAQRAAFVQLVRQQMGGTE